MLHVALSSLGALVSWYVTFQVGSSFRAINAYKRYLAGEVFPWVIGCNVFVKLFLEILFLGCQKVPTLPGLATWPANVQIYIGAATDVLVCYVSLLRINLSYLCLAIFPFMAISFICVLCLRHNSRCGRADVKSGSSTTTGTDNGKKAKMPQSSKSKSTDNGKKATAIPEKFNKVALIAPHFILCMFGMLGDPDHDGNNYDISNFFLFLTCLLLELTLMMVRLPAGTSRGIAPASEMLYKASLVVLLLTAHMVAADAFGKDVVLLLLPEIVPLLLWIGLHLDRRTSIVDVQKIMDCEDFVWTAMVVAICGYIVLVPNDESWFFRLYWASTSCAVSGLITHVIALVLRLWPEKVGIATLSFDEAPKLLKFWGSVLFNAAVGLFAFGGQVEVFSH